MAVIGAMYDTDNDCVQHVRYLYAKRWLLRFLVSQRQAKDSRI